MAKGKVEVKNFIKSTDSRSKSVDPTDENLSTIDIGKDFVSSTSGIIIKTGTNVTSGKSRND